MTLLSTVLFCFIIQSLLLYSSTLSRYCEVGLFCHLVYKFASSLGTLDIFFPFDLLRYLEGELPSLHLWFYVSSYFTLEGHMERNYFPTLCTYNSVLGFCQHLKTSYEKKYIFCFNILQRNKRETLNYAGHLKFNCV
jgi:hypothetical protein